MTRPREPQPLDTKFWKSLRSIIEIERTSEAHDHATARTQIIALGQRYNLSEQELEERGLLWPLEPTTTEGRRKGGRRRARQTGTRDHA